MKFGRKCGVEVLVKARQDFETHHSREAARSRWEGVPGADPHLPSMNKEAAIVEPDGM